MEEKTIVLDASVVVKWYVEERNSDKALEIRELFRDNLINVVVPELLYYEVINAIRFNSNIDPVTKSKIADNLFEIEFDTIIPTKEHYTDALNYAIKKNLTINDSIYYIIANEVNGTYVTADEEFWEKTKNKSIVLLKNWKKNN